MKTSTPIVLFLLFSCLTIAAQTTRITVKLTPKSVSNQQLKKTIENNVSRLLSSINTAYVNLENPAINEDYISPEALLKVQEVFENTPFFCKENNLLLNLLQTQKGFQLRNILVRADEIEQLLVIDLLEDGTIDDVYFGLELHQYDNIMNFNSVVDRTRREIILNFVENFRTAYIRKDIELIETVFSDKALIITGKVVQPDGSRTDVYKTTLTKKQIEYQVLTKGQYISRLREVFRKTPYLNLKFEEIEVAQHRKFPDFYGVELNQTWASPNYSDQGYLFLLIQFRQDDNPLIWVRTWQDAKDFEKDSAFGLHNFKIYENAIY